MISKLDKHAAAILQQREDILALVLPNDPGLLNEDGLRKALRARGKAVGESLACTFRALPLSSPRAWARSEASLLQQTMERRWCA